MRSSKLAIVAQRGEIEKMGRADTSFMSKRFGETNTPEQMKDLLAFIEELSGGDKIAERL